MMTVKDNHESGQWDGSIDPLADEDERQLVFAALDSFRQYRKNAHYNCTHRRRQNLYALPSAQWKMLSKPPFSLLDNLNAVDDAIDSNAEIADAILQLGLQTFDLSTSSDWQNTATPNDVAKAHSTIRQFYRDWSAEGAIEREVITKTILEDLHLQPTRNVLVPGAGLARLVFDLTALGYNATGNENSYHQLLASNVILNHTKHAGQYKLYPFATTFTNLHSRSHQLREVTIPDIHPATAIAEKSVGAVGKMSMHAGDFVATYTSAEQTSAFDAVVSVFFVDTASNPIRYIEAVRNCLSEGGLWINIGPLLWHFDSNVIKEPDENRHEKELASNVNRRADELGSFELADDELLLLLQNMGFETVSHEMLRSGVGLGYIQDPESMLQNMYRCSHWVARKR